MGRHLLHREVGLFSAFDLFFIYVCSLLLFFVFNVCFLFSILCVSWLFTCDFTLQCKEVSFLKNVHIFSVFCVFFFFNFVSFTWYFGVSEFATVIWWRNFVNVLWICYFRHMFLVGYTRLTYELHTSLMLLKNLKILRFCLSQLLFYLFFLELCR